MNRMTLFGRGILDRYGKAVVVVSNLHAYIHEERGFSLRLADAALAGSATIYLQLDIPADLRVHLKSVVVYTSGDVATFLLLEAPTHTTGSNALTPLNKNRNSSLASGITVFDDPTGISAGTTLDSFTFGGGKFSSSLLEALGEEWIMKKSATTILSLTNNDVGAAAVFLAPIWYEPK